MDFSRVLNLNGIYGDEVGYPLAPIFVKDEMPDAPSLFLAKCRVGLDQFMPFDFPLLLTPETLSIALPPKRW